MIACMDIRTFPQDRDLLKDIYFVWHLGSKIGETKQETIFCSRLSSRCGTATENGRKDRFCGTQKDKLLSTFSQNCWPLCIFWINVYPVIGQQVYAKMISVTNHQGNANQNHNELSSYTSQDGYYLKDMCVCQSLCEPMDYSPPGSSVCGDSPGKKTGGGYLKEKRQKLLTRMQRKGNPCALLKCKLIQLFWKQYRGSSKN